MKPSTLQQFLSYMILLLVIANRVQGKAQFTKVPSSPLYVVSGKTARFVWDYTVDNRNKEFQLFSPTWKYYYANGTAVNIGYENSLRDWGWIITYGTCPSRLLKPIIRVKKESTATLVISNVTIADSGIYGMVLLLTTASPITSKIQLIVTTRPKFTSRFQRNIIVLQDSDLRLRCSATGMPTPNITWVFLKEQTQEIKSQGVGYAELFVQNITRHQSGTYQCQATNNPNEYPVEKQTEVTIWSKSLRPTASIRNNPISSSNAFYQGRTFTIVHLSITCVLVIIIVVLLTYICIKCKIHSSKEDRREITRFSRPVVSRKANEDRTFEVERSTNNDVLTENESKISPTEDSKKIPDKSEPFSSSETKNSAQGTRDVLSETHHDYQELLNNDASMPNIQSYQAPNRIPGDTVRPVEPPLPLQKYEALNSVNNPQNSEYEKLHLYAIIGNKN